MPDILVQQVVKSFDARIALNKFSLSVEKGELYGLIGPDGAGKTTLMRLLCSLLHADNGLLQIRSMDVTTDFFAIRKLLGYMPQRFSLYQDLTVEQNLRFFADLFGVSKSVLPQRMAELYDFSRLGAFKKRKAGALSGGMKQKLALSCNLVHAPDIMILDEPTFGVDPVSRKEFWQILHDLHKQGKTILVSTPYMDEAEQCDAISLLSEGQEIAQGSPDAVRSRYKQHLYALTAKDIHGLRRFFEQQKKALSIQLFGDSLHVSFTQKPSQQDWDNYQAESNGNILSYTEIAASMEDIFLALSRKDNNASNL
jgi:ABC-2 type transport system ATP-binding protein